MTKTPTAQTGSNSPTGVDDSISLFFDMVSALSETRAEAVPSTPTTAISDNGGDFRKKINAIVGKIQEETNGARSVLGSVSRDSTSTEHLIASAEHAISAGEPALEVARNKGYAPNAESQEGEEVALEDTELEETLAIDGCGLMSIFGLVVNEGGEGAAPGENATEDQTLGRDIDNPSCNLDIKGNLGCFPEVNASESTHTMSNIKQAPSSPQTHENSKTRYSPIKNAEQQTNEAELELKQMQCFQLEVLRLAKGMIDTDNDGKTSEGSTYMADAFELDEVRGDNNEASAGPMNRDDTFELDKGDDGKDDETSAGSTYRDVASEFDDDDEHSAGSTDGDGIFELAMSLFKFPGESASISSDSFSKTSEARRNGGDPYANMVFV